MNFILIDGSYFIFYRYYALCVWWKMSKHHDESDNPCENERFMSKFRETIVSKTEELETRLGLDSSVKIVGKDCPKANIWRNKHINNYKTHRTSDDTNIGSLFKIVYDEELFTKASCKTVLEHPCLEADDCLAITTRHICSKYPDAKIWIITSDMDYLQLASEQVTLIDLKYKNLRESKNSYKDAEKDLFCKIVSGDKSDNIPSVFPRCGQKTAAKYYDNKELFHAKLNEDPIAKTCYDRNRTIIDFNCIPDSIVDEFSQTLEQF